MHPVDEIASPALALNLLLVLLVFGHELLLLAVVGLEEEGAGLVEGAPQTHQQLAHAGCREPSTEGSLDPVANLSGALEAPRGHLLFEQVELSSGQSAGVAFVLQGAEGIEALFPEQGDPVMDRPR